MSRDIQVLNDQPLSVRFQNGDEIGYQPHKTDDVGSALAVLEELRMRDAILEVIGFSADHFLRKQNLDESIQLLISQLGSALQVSRVYIFQNSTTPDGVLFMSQTHEWAAPGVEPQIDNPELQELYYHELGFERWVEYMQRGRPLYGVVKTFPEGERAILEPQEILSIVVVPIFVRGEWWGFVGFDDCERERSWSSVEIDALRAAVTIVGSAIQRQQDEERYIGMQQQIIEAQQATLRELSTPLLPIAAGVVLVPLIGTIDSGRANLVMETLLDGVARFNARLAILDITGVPVVDTHVAQALISAAQAVKLLGAKVILTGIKPQIAQTLVELGIDLRGIATRATLQDGVAAILHH